MEIGLESDTQVGIDNISFRIKITYLGSDTVWFWDLATNFSTKEKVQDLHPLESMTVYKRPCHLLTLLAESKS